MQGRNVDASLSTSDVGRKSFFEILIPLFWNIISVLIYPFTKSCNSQLLDPGRLFRFVFISTPVGFLRQREDDQPISRVPADTQN